MMSPFQIVRRFALNLLAWGLIAAGAYALGTRLPQPASYGVWAVAAALLCAIGAMLIYSQPVGRPTFAGRLGYFAVHFGFRAGQGRLVVAAGISWLVWVVIGSAVIWSAAGGWHFMQTAMAVAWTINTLALFYALGIVVHDRPRPGAPEGARLRTPPAIVKLSFGLVALIAASGVLWWAVGTHAARLAAVLLAAGPLAVVGGGYGLFMLVMLTVGRNVRWN